MKLGLFPNLTFALPAKLWNHEGRTLFRTPVRSIHCGRWGTNGQTNSLNLPGWDEGIIPYIYIFHRRLTVRFLFNPMSHERRNWRRFWTENPEIASTYLVGKSVEVGCRECKTVFNVVRVARSWVCNLLCLAGRGLFWGERQHSSDLTKWEKRLMAYQCVGMSSTSSTS